MTDNELKIALFLQKMGLTKAQIAGVIGNLKVESNLSPTAYNPNDKGQPSQGLAQWRGSRRAGLLAYAKRVGKDPNSLDAQLGYMREEFLGSENSAFLRLKGAGTAAEAAVAFDKYYERSDGTARTQRVQYANDWYAGKTLGSGNATDKGTPSFAALAGAVMRYRGDMYSQTFRWSEGYSDCSSIIGKAFKDLGIEPPGTSTTIDYAVWNKLQLIPRSQVAAGDILNKAGVHMVVALDNTTAIGQQRAGRNVQVGPIDGDLMYGATPYKCYRYVGNRPGEDELLKGGIGLPDISFPTIPFSGLDFILNRGKNSKEFVERGGEAAGEAAGALTGSVVEGFAYLLLTPNDEGVSMGLRIVMFLGGMVGIAIAATALVKGAAVSAASKTVGTAVVGDVAGAASTVKAARTPGAQEVHAPRANQVVAK